MSKITIKTLDMIKHKHILNCYDIINVYITCNIIIFQYYFQNKFLN